MIKNDKQGKYGGRLQMTDLPVEYYKKQLDELDKKRYWTPYNFREYKFLKNKIERMEKGATHK